MIGRLVRLGLRLVAVLAGLPFVALAAVRVLRLDERNLLALQVESLFYESLLGLVIATIISLGLWGAGVRTGRGRRVLLAVWLVAAVLVWPSRPGQRIESDAAGPQVRIVTANVFVGNADIGGLYEQLDAMAADVVVLQEYRPEMTAALDASAERSCCPAIRSCAPA